MFKKKNIAEMEMKEMIEMVNHCNQIKQDLDTVLFLLRPIIAKKTKPDKKIDKQVKDHLKKVIEELRKLDNESKDVLIKELKREKQ